MDTTRVCPPALIATLVRAIAAVAGTPPKNGKIVFPIPVQKVLCLHEAAHVSSFLHSLRKAKTRSSQSRNTDKPETLSFASDPWYL